MILAKLVLTSTIMQNTTIERLQCTDIVDMILYLLESADSYEIKDRQYEYRQFSEK